MALPCNNLNLNLYRVFYTVAKTKSFSESSRTLHISQPAISKHIQNLEYELNTILFHRTNRGIELTPEAKALLVYVEKAYNYLMLGERELQEGKEQLKGTITIGAPTYVSIYYINEYVKKFMEEHPKIVIKIVNQNEDALLELFNQHSLDLLISGMNGNKIDKEMKVVSFETDEYCFAYNKEIMGELNIVSCDAVLQKNVMLPSKKKKARKLLDESLTIRGIISEPVMELDEIEMMVSYTKSGLGIGYMPKRVAELNDLEVISVDMELPKDDIHLVYNDAILTTSSREFVDILVNKS